jgi:hypothetical protein
VRARWRRNGRDFRQCVSLDAPPNYTRHLYIRVLIRVLVVLYVSSYYYGCPTTCAPLYIRLLVLLCMRPHTTTYVSSCYCICVLTHLTLLHMWVLVLLYMCPHTTIYRPKLGFAVRALRRARTPTDRAQYICVLILPYMCPHTTICVLIQTLAWIPYVRSPTSTYAS